MTRRIRNPAHRVRRHDLRDCAVPMNVAGQVGKGVLDANQATERNC
jgi:hypothetical protein